MELQTTLRHAKLEDAVDLLRQQADVKYDVVSPSTHLRYEAGLLHVKEGAANIFDMGVSLTDAVLDPTVTFEDNLAGRLDIPRAYLRRCREAQAAQDAVTQVPPYPVPILDRTVNYWMAQSDKNWFVRGYRADEGVGIARAILSDRYLVVDNIDTLFASLDGMRAAGIGFENGISVDMTDKRMRVKVTAPQIQALAPVFLRDYRSPFTGETGASNPVIFAGLVISNSETGHGAFQIAPQITVQICNNGMTRTVDAVRKVHLGGTLEQGVVRWGQDTQGKALELITAQTRDAVRTFLSHEYLNSVAAELDNKAEVRLERPMEAVENVCKSFKMSEEEQAHILDFFIRGGDTRAVGVMQAVTAYAQDLEDVERSVELEESAFAILDSAVREAR